MYGISEGVSMKIGTMGGTFEIRSIKNNGLCYIFAQPALTPVSIWIRSVLYAKGMPSSIKKTVYTIESRDS